MTTLREAAQQALEALLLCDSKDAGKAMAAITALRAALEQPERAQQQRDAGFTRRPTIREMSEPEQPEQPEQEPVAISWVLDGDKDCGYNNWLGKTPFGRILITWKGWKEYHNACVDEFPGGFQAYGEPDDVKAACEAEYIKRLCHTQPAARN